MSSSEYPGVEEETQRIIDRFAEMMRDFQEEGARDGDDDKDDRAPLVIIEDDNEEEEEDAPFDGGSYCAAAHGEDREADDLRPYDDGADRRPLILFPVDDRRMRDADEEPDGDRTLVMMGTAGDDDLDRAAAPVSIDDRIVGQEKEYDDGDGEEEEEEGEEDDGGGETSETPADGRPPIGSPARGSASYENVRVVRVARGVVDDGSTAIVIDEARLNVAAYSSIVVADSSPSFAPSSGAGSSSHTNLNGAAYETAALVSYLYAEEPAVKTVPHTRQRLTPLQVNAVLSLIEADHAHIVVPPDADDGAYALSGPIDPAAAAVCALPRAASSAVDAHLERVLVEEEEAVDPKAYYVDALEHYPVEIAMAIGWDYKPAVNFGVARYMSIAGTPLLAEEGGLLPDEIPRRRTAPPNAAAAATATAGQLLASCAEGVEPRDEAVKRHRALVDRRRRHPPMGMDLELVAALLQAEADTGLARDPCNLGEMRRLLRLAVGARIKPSKVDRKIDRYAVPWAYGICCALDRRDVDEVLSSPEGAAAVRARMDRAWAAETGAGDPEGAAAAGATAAAAAPLGRKPLRPLAPYLSDAEYRARLERLEPPLLAALVQVIPLEARGRTHLDAGDYVVYESNLAVGAPLSPPMGHSLAQKVMRFRRAAGMAPRACDLAPKPPSIVFVRDCPPAP
jgi:hypothetical protein